MHHFTRVSRIFLLDRNDREIMKHALNRQVHIDDFRQGHSEQRKKQSLGGFAEMGVFHRRATDDGRRINRIFSMRDARDMKGGIIIGERIKAGVITERSLAPQRLGWIDVAFDNDVRVGRHLDIHRDSLDQFDALFAQKTGKENFIDLVGQWRGRRIGHRRIAAQTDGEFQLAGFFFLMLKVARADFMQVPVHASRARIEDLHTIEADVARALNRVIRKNHRQSDEGSAVSRPASENRQNVQIGLAMDNLLTNAFLYELRRNPGQFDEFA